MVAQGGTRLESGTVILSETKNLGGLPAESEILRVKCFEVALRMTVGRKE
jgi:hypothetical protein